MEEGFSSTAAYPQDTGLSKTISIMSNMICEHAGFAPVNPHLRVSQHPGDQLDEEHTFHITLEDEPRVTGNTGWTTRKDMALLQAFVKANKASLVQHWIGEDDSITVLKSLVKVSETSGEGRRSLHQAQKALAEGVAVAQRVYQVHPFDP